MANDPRARPQIAVDGQSLPCASHCEVSGEKLITALLKPSLVRTEEFAVKQKAQDVVDFLNLTHLSNELAGNLSGGQKKLLELGRTMMVDAKLVLLDEVGAGVNRTLLKELGTAILKLNKEQGYTF